MGAVIADPLAQSLFAAAGILLLVVLGREWFLLRRDAWIDPETADQRQVLATAAVALATAERMETISRRVSRAVKRGCGSPSTLLVATDLHPDAHDFRASDTAIAPLPRTSATVHMLETAGGPLHVHPSDSKSVFELLPVAEAPGWWRRPPT